MSFSILAILIFCLGLLGMAFLVTEQRNKEIGIRKTMGASKTNIIYLLLFDFVKWILIANVIAWPIAWFYMQNWLQDYAFKIKPGMELFLLAGIIALLIAVMVVIVQAIRSARANPAVSLKYE